MGDGQHQNATVLRNLIDHRVGKPRTKPPPSTARYGRTGVWSERHERSDPAHLGHKVLTELRELRPIVPRGFSELRQRL